MPTAHAPPRPPPAPPGAESFQPPALRGVEASVTLKMTELFSYDLPEVCCSFRFIRGFGWLAGRVFTLGGMW